VRDICADWTVDMGRDGQGKRRPKRTVEAHLLFDPRRHADRVAALDGLAAQETFAGWACWVSAASSGMNGTRDPCSTASITRAKVVWGSVPAWTAATGSRSSSCPRSPLRPLVPLGGSNPPQCVRVAHALPPTCSN
jgi:hypothetical protein